jgi:hypothetical protein
MKLRVFETSQPTMSALLTSLAAAVVSLAMAGVGQAVVIGEWDNSPDGWIDWANQESIDSAANMPSRYSYTTHNGEPGILLTEPSFRQSLSIKLPFELRDDFLDNSLFKVDLTVFSLPGTTSGFTKIEQVTLNAEGASGFGDPTYRLNPDNDYFFGWGAEGQASATIVWDYSAYHPIAEQIQIDESRLPNWIEIIITTNGGGSTQTGNFIFQNARLVPEPASILLLGFGLVGLALHRRRRS